jgi:hypothetical protein
MKGTEKQIKWAEDIIDGAIKALEHAADLARLDNEKEYVENYIKPMIDSINAHRETWSAAEWIDKRWRFDPQVLFQRVLYDDLRGYCWGVQWKEEVGYREGRRGYGPHTAYRR